MANFPDSIMPKTLKRETESEVNGSPLIYNAFDHNMHVRELVAIQKYIGTNASDGQTLANLVAEAFLLLKKISIDGLVSQHAGVVADGEAVPIPENIASATVTGPLSAVATSITVSSTEGFPSKGFIAKFNDLTAAFTTGRFTAFDIGLQMQSQEVIQYTSKTDTSFEGCTRDATAAQAVAADGEALVIAARAAVMLGQTFWKKASGSVPVTEYYVKHDATLVTTAGAYGPTGSTTILDALGTAYSLTLVASFEDIDMSLLFNAGL